MEALAPAAPGPAGEGRGDTRTPPHQLAEALHALAQLPDDVGLEIGCDERELDRLRLLASAYGVEERVGLHGSPVAQAAWVRGGERIPYDHERTLAETVESLWPPGVESWLGTGDDQVLEGHRVAVVSNLPAPYRIPLFAGISRRLEAVGGSLRVLFLRSSAGSRTWLASDNKLDFDHAFVPGVDLPIRHRPPRLPIGLGAALRRYRPTISLSAGLSPVVSGTVQRSARRAGIPFGLWSGEIAAIAAMHSRARQLQRRRLAQSADFGIAYSALAAQYLAQLAPQLPIVLGRNSSVVQVSCPSRPARPEPVELLVVGDLASPRKGVDVLIHALRAVPDLGCRLSVVGGGRLQGDLEDKAAGDARIRFLGPLSATAVNSAYAESDVFLFPSRQDVFGLVLTEAMSHGLAPVVSSAVGALPDVAVPGLNCVVIGNHEPGAWAEAISRLAENHDHRSALGSAARRTISRRWTVAHSAEGWMAGFRLAANLTSRSGGHRR
jgi:glycosyltransferase involved in cell wall biosynthesis